MILSNNPGLLGRLIVFFLALLEWAFMFQYVYCMERFRENFGIRLISAVLVILGSLGVIIAQGKLYQPISLGRFSVNEFNVVVIAEGCVSLFILFYGLRKFRTKGTIDARR